MSKGICLSVNELARIRDLLYDGFVPNNMIISDIHSLFIFGEYTQFKIKNETFRKYYNDNQLYIWDGTLDAFTYLY